MHKAFTVSLQSEQSCAKIRISSQVRCTDGAFSADLLQVVLGLPFVSSPLVLRYKNDVTVCGDTTSLNETDNFLRPILELVDTRKNYALA